MISNGSTCNTCDHFFCLDLHVSSYKDGVGFSQKNSQNKNNAPPPKKINSIVFKNIYVALNETWATQYFSIFFMQL